MRDGRLPRCQIRRVMSSMDFTRTFFEASKQRQWCGGWLHRTPTFGKERGRKQIRRELGEKRREGSGRNGHVDLSAKAGRKG